MKTNCWDGQGAIEKAESVQSVFHDFDGVHPATEIDVFDGSDEADNVVQGVYTKVLGPIADNDDWTGPWKRHFDTLHNLANGAQGTVQLCKRRTTGNLFVVKSIVLDEVDKHTRQLEDAAEFTILAQRLGPHPNIVFLQFARLDYDLDDLPTRRLFYEFCSGGDLGGFIRRWRKYDRPVPDLFIYHVLATMSAALAYLHGGLRRQSDGTGWAVCPKHTGEIVLHRDIKPQNIFLRFPGANDHGLPDVVLGDFGFASTESDNFGAVGTPDWFPPEVGAVWALRDVDEDAYFRLQDGKVMSPATDVYGLGLVAHHLMTCEYFIDDPDSARLGNGPGVDYPNRLWAGVRWMLERQPVLRLPTAYLDRFSDAMAAQVDAEVAAGHIMPLDSWDDPPGWLDEDSVFSDRGLTPPPPVSGSAVAGAEPEEVDELCVCPNYHSVSLPGAGPGCISDTSLAAPACVANTATAAQGMDTRKSSCGRMGCGGDEHERKVSSGMGDTARSVSASLHEFDEA